MNRKYAAWILHHTCAQSYFRLNIEEISGFSESYNTLLRTLHGLGCPPRAFLHSTSPEVWEQRPASLPDRYVKEPCPSREEQRYNTILASLGARVNMQKSRRGGAKRRLGGGKPFLATIVLIRRDKCRDSSREMKSFIATNRGNHRDKSPTPSEGGAESWR